LVCQYVSFMAELIVVPPVLGIWINIISDIFSKLLLFKQLH